MGQKQTAEQRAQARRKIEATNKLFAAAGRYGSSIKINSWPVDDRPFYRTYENLGSSRCHRLQSVSCFTDGGLS